MTRLHRLGCVFAVILSVVVSLTATEQGTGATTRSGDSFKYTARTCPPASVLARDPHRRPGTGSGSGRFVATAAWISALARPASTDGTATSKLSSRPASTFPPYWSSLHLTI